MADHWEPIRVYEVGVTAPDSSTTRAQVVGWLDNTDPGGIESAGESYVYAAQKLRGDEGSVQSHLMTAANKLTGAWRGQDATQVLEALRLLYASAGALGEAMHGTGTQMKEYGQAVSRARSSVPAETPTDEGDGGGMGSVPSSEIMYEAPSTDPDAAARRHMERLNNQISTINSQISEGLAFQLPEITPIEVTTRRQDRLDPNGGTNVPTGRTTYWDGGGDGTGGSSGSNGSAGSDRTTGGGDGSGSQRDTPQDQDQRTPPDQRGDDPSADPQHPDQPGGADDSQNQPGDQGQNQDGSDRPQEDVPPVIGGNDDRTQLADTNTPPTTTTPNGNPTTNPYQHTPNTVFPTQTPSGTSTPFGGGGGSTWYGTSGGAPAASPAVLRGGATPGSGLMGYPPLGMGAAAANEGGEREREIYDPDPGVWHIPHNTSPDKIG
ncbi:WXG100 family type VII secretion target [Nonomuraea purpurea]|uniref:WXG100 family type VII secretion target n=1 Tax=Nonomuraea purpurea TaxID=1849276 RepID=A0ABV8GNW3_9ACTN